MYMLYVHVLVCTIIILVHVLQYFCSLVGWTFPWQSYTSTNQRDWRVPITRSLCSSHNIQVSHVTYSLWISLRIDLFYTGTFSMYIHRLWTYEVSINVTLESRYNSWEERNERMFSQPYMGIPERLVVFSSIS